MFRANNFIKHYTRKISWSILDLSCWNCEHSFTPIGRCWNYHLVVEIRDVKDLRFWNYPCFIINGKLLWQVGKWKPQEISKLKMIWHDTNKSVIKCILTWLAPVTLQRISPKIHLSINVESGVSGTETKILY